MSLRIADEQDYEAVMQLLCQLNPADPPLSQRIGKVTYTKIIETDGLDLVVAEIDTRIVSTCYLNVVPNLSRRARPYALIENLVTDEGYRNRGLGKAVIDYALELAWRTDCYKVMLLTGRKDESVVVPIANASFPVTKTRRSCRGQPNNAFESFAVAH